MPPEQIINAVTTVGFPIMACCVLFSLYDKAVKAIAQTLTELKDILNEIKKDIEQMKGERQ